MSLQILTIAFKNNSQSSSSSSSDRVDSRGLLRQPGVPTTAQEPKSRNWAPVQSIVLK